MSQRPWFHEGLRFQCTACGDCCTGPPGFVWVNREETTRLAARLGMPLDEFERKYTRKVGIRRSLVEFPNGDCVFFDGRTRKCQVYEDRPRQCRTWPFWQSNIATEEAWKKTCEICPGSGKGPLVTVEQIIAQASVMKL